MSTVLWANVLVAGKVVSDQSDHGALYKHANKLDSIAKECGFLPFLAMCDTTDQQVNIGKKELPSGMKSTEEMMASEGKWASVE